MKDKIYFVVNGFDGENYDYPLIGIVINRPNTKVEQKEFGKAIKHFKDKFDHVIVTKVCRYTDMLGMRKTFMKKTVIQ